MKAYFSGLPPNPPILKKWCKSFSLGRTCTFWLFSPEEKEEGKNNGDRVRDLCSNILVIIVHIQTSEVCQSFSGTYANEA